MALKSDDYSWCMLDWSHERSRLGQTVYNKIVPPSIKYFTMLGIKLYKNKPTKQQDQFLSKLQTL